MIQCASTGLGGQARLRCGTEYGSAVNIASSNYVYSDYTLAITITAPVSPLMLAVQFRTNGNDWVGVKNTTTDATITPSMTVF